MKRTLIGSLFGQPGMYVSQPGDDLDNPTRSLLLDSRFSSLDIYSYGRLRLHREFVSGIRVTRYYREEPFASPGYIPTYYATFVRNDQAIAQYPYSLGGGSNFLGQFSYDGHIEITSNTISFFLTFDGEQSFTVDAMYVIYRNPQ